MEKLPPNVTTQLKRPLRFFWVSLLAAGLDASGAGATLFFGGSPFLAICMGWACGVGIGYVFNELWTFKQEASRLTWKRFGLFAANCAFIVPLRMFIVWLLAFFTPTGTYWDAGHILCAMGVSLVLNYLVSSKFVFRK